MKISKEYRKKGLDDYLGFGSRVDNRAGRKLPKKKDGATNRAWFTKDSPNTFKKGNTVNKGKKKTIVSEKAKATQFQRGHPDLRIPQPFEGTKYELPPDDYQMGN
jgi:hypothetical protein